MTSLESNSASQILIDVLFRENIDDSALGYVEKNLDDVLKTAWRNRVTLRLLTKLSKLSNCSPSLRMKLARLIESEEQRREKILRLIGKVTSTFREEGVRYVSIKTMDNYPDFGHDLDYLVDRDFDRASKQLQDRLGATAIKGLAVSDRIVGKRAFKIPKPLDAGVEVELYPKLSQVGDQILFNEIIFSRAEERTIAGIQVTVPSKEDVLLIYCVHALYRSLGIRISEIHNLTTLIKTTKIDWDYAFEHAIDANISRGLSFLIQFLDAFHQKYLGENFIPQWLKRYCKRFLDGRVQVPQNYPNEFGISYFARTYLNKGLADIRDLRIRSAGSALIAAPALAFAAFLVYHTTGRTNLFW